MIFLIIIAAIYLGIGVSCIIIILLDSDDMTTFIKVEFALFMIIGWPVGLIYMRFKDVLFKRIKNIVKSMYFMILEEMYK